MRYLISGLYFLALIAFVPAGASEHEGFLGAYSGIYSGAIDGVEQKRDLSVKIEELDDGFNASWKTTIFRDGKEKTKEYSIDFLESDRSHIYEAAQKKNVFGGREPLDPMKGDPYFWARIEGPKLTVFAMIVMEDGGYEMQTFDRVLTEDNNLHLNFSRVRNGEILKSIEAILTRIPSGEY